MNVFELYASLDLNAESYYDALSQARTAASDEGEAIQNTLRQSIGDIPAPDTVEYARGLGEAEKDSETFVDQVNSVFQKLGVVAAVAAAGKAIVDFGNEAAEAIKETAEYGDSIDKMSQKIGISAEAYQEWDAVMQHSGTSISTLQGAMRTLTKQVESGSEAFKQLGISEQEVAELSKEDLFSRVIEGLQGMEEGSERAYLAQQLLGRGASEYGALLNTSAEATQEMKDRVHELNGVMSTEAIQASAAFQDQLQDMNTALDGLKRNITNEFLPSIAEVMNGLADIFSGDYDEGVNRISEGIDGFVERFNELPSKISDVGKNIISSLGEAIIQNIPDLTSVGADVINFMITTLVDNAPMLVESAFTMVSTLAKGISDNLPELVPSSVEAVIEVADTLLDNADMLVDAGFSLIEGLGEGLIQALPTLISRAPEIVTKLATEVIYLAPKMVASGIELIVQLFSGLLDPKTWTESIDKLAEQFGSMKVEFTTLGHNLWDALISAWEAYYNRDFSKWKQYGADIYNQLNGGISTVSGGHARGGISEGIDQMADDIEQSVDNLYDTSVEAGTTISKSGETITKYANDYGRNADQAYAAMFEGRQEAMDDGLKKFADNLDYLFATHKLTQEEYDRRMSTYLSEHTNTTSALWWKYYDGIEKSKEQSQAQALKADKEAQSRAAEEAKKTAEGVEETTASIGSIITGAFSVMTDSISTSFVNRMTNVTSVISGVWGDFGTAFKQMSQEHAKELEEGTKTYTNTLQGIWDGYVGQLDLWKKIDISDTLTAWQIGDIDRQTAGLQKYEDTYKAVLGRMGDEIDDTEKNLLKKISGMNLEDKTSFTDYLASMTEAEFNKYMQSYKKYVEQAGELAAIEGNSISDINEEIAKSLISDVDYEGIGKTGAEQYLSGFYEGIKNFTIDVGTVSASTTEISQVVPVKSTPAQTTPESITVNINGIQFKTVDELTQALVQAITNTTNRRKAGYAV